MKKIYLNEIAKMFNIAESTLRFYDKKGLLPKLNRDKNNYRYMLEKDLEWINIIVCLKKTGINLAGLKKYIALALSDKDTIKERYQIILEQEQELNKMIKNLEEQRDYIKYKKNIYEEQIKKN